MTREAAPAACPSVLHLDTERGWGGGQQQVAWLIEGMRSKGVPAALVCPRGSVLEDRARAAGWPAHPLPMRGEWDVVAGLRIARMARAGGHRILHAHSGHALALALWARLFAPSLRLVGTRRVAFPVRGGPAGRLKHASAFVDRVMCISEAVRTVLLAAGVPPSRLVVIPSGVDTHRFEKVRPPPAFRRSLGIPNGHLVVGTVAALVPSKDYPTLLRAARRVVERAPDTTFVAVGDGPLRAEAESLARSLDLHRRFLFAGFREDVGSFLRLFDVFVLASRTEGMGTSILDAQAVGLPVAACRAGGVAEIVADRETGLLVPPGEPDALADAVLELLGDPRLRAALGARAKRKVREHDISRTVEAHLRLYRALLPD